MDEPMTIHRAVHRILCIQKWRIHQILVWKTLDFSQWRTLSFIHHRLTIRITMNNRWLTIGRYSHGLAYNFRIAVNMKNSAHLMWIANNFCRLHQGIIIITVIRCQRIWPGTAFVRLNPKKPNTPMYHRWHPQHRTRTKIQTPSL